MAVPSILLISGSTRKNSYNGALVAIMAQKLIEKGANATILDLKQYPLPLYDEDLESEQGIPANALALHEIFRNSNSIFIASPEYNANVSPLLLNVLAWVSRVTDHGGQFSAFVKPVYALASASPAGFGGYRGLMSLRNTLELQLGSHVLPTMLSVGVAHETITPEGTLKNKQHQILADKMTEELMRFSLKSL